MCNTFLRKWHSYMEEVSSREKEWYENWPLEYIQRKLNKLERDDGKNSFRPQTVNLWLNFSICKRRSWWFNKVDKRKRKDFKRENTCAYWRLFGISGFLLDWPWIETKNLSFIHSIYTSSSATWRYSFHHREVITFRHIFTNKQWSINRTILQIRGLFTSWLCSW